MRDFHLPGRSEVFGTHGMVATSHPLSSKVAIQILEAGGNAMDAAMAAAVLQGICEPQMTGIGGDMFALISPTPTADIIAFNGSGRAPAALNAADLRAEGHEAMPVFSAHAVTVPGAVDAMCQLSVDHGKIGLKAILAPSIYYAEAGVPVAPRVAHDWAGAASDIPDHAAEHLLPDGKAPEPGYLYRVPKQAEALRRIAMDGRDGFYEGEVAEDMVATLQAHGGVHTLEDFANVRGEYTTPITGTYGPYELVEHPPNGSGATAILILNILKHFDLSGMDPFGAERAHIEVEAAKLAYDTRDRVLGDADHVTRLDHMLSPDTAAALAKLIDPTKVIASPHQASEEVHKETITLSVVDKDGMAVSLIYSIFKDFGSRIMSDKFGVMFHNRGAGFNLKPGHVNEAMGGKRPLHTIIPGMLRQNGRTVMPFGVMGGAYQPHGHARFITNMVDFGLSPQEAIDGPRCFFDQGELRTERGYTPDVRQSLADLGHPVNSDTGPIGGAQAILIREDGVLVGASDPRKDGCALGY
ncbi:gamma-glutamyltransferase family protein [Shimia ponticola]|uniref:gamma-glutamyltransferase family protein n=1 Tax=Shimia ponticola TaxID=2582893 RepID=UPI0011BEA349|nr:gamma-glutamyltransferase family protein [Shimia ponticola]